ncbi:MAG: hypothetical protein LC781_03770 [Actinobacteria bacterium]|nr:hypothetical protein [Actinomycetota bacterium]
MNPYWYVGVAPVSGPYWDGVVMCEMEAEDVRVVAPMLFSTRENAEEELRVLREGEADAYIRAVIEYGESDVNEALDNTPELRVFEIDPWLLGEHLEDSAPMHVMVDGRVRFTWKLAEELRGA